MRLLLQIRISTHSRAKAAGFGAPPAASTAIAFQLTAARRRLAYVPRFSPPLITHFNSQPREGGWRVNNCLHCANWHFNSQPREGGWRMHIAHAFKGSHFNSQPREGGWCFDLLIVPSLQNFNSQPREGGWSIRRCRPAQRCHFNSQPREGGWHGTTPIGA